MSRRRLVSAAVLQRQLSAALPPGATVLTAAEARAEQMSQATGRLGFVTTFLLAFAGVALVAAVFIVWNTFTLLFTRRSGELALLRVLGARPGQLLRATLAEEALVGVVASLCGLGLGIGATKVLGAALARTGTALPRPVPRPGNWIQLQLLPLLRPCFGPLHNQRSTWS